MLDGCCTRFSMCCALPTLLEEMLFGACDAGGGSAFGFRSWSGLSSCAQLGNGWYASKGKSNACANDPTIQAARKPSASPATPCCASGTQAPAAPAPMQARQYHAPKPASAESLAAPPLAMPAFAASLSLFRARAVSRMSHATSKAARLLMWSTMASNLGKSRADSSADTGSCGEEAGASIAWPSPAAFSAWKAHTLSAKPKICCFTSCRSVTKVFDKRRSTSGPSRGASRWYWPMIHTTEARAVGAARSAR
mmetsp:Transcript_104987/g.303787  ORF Transcript_104987/g.303787 Transcript_104987/m.303787 type:complete len:252 (+) Transcript_104987:117-872(+)